MSDLIPFLRKVLWKEITAKKIGPLSETHKRRSGHNTEKHHPIVPEDSAFLCFPRGPRFKSPIMMLPDVPVTRGVSAEDISKQPQCSTSSTARPRARRKRKTKLKVEQSDSEETFCRRTHIRGRARRGQNIINPITKERGKLDSATFLHYFMHVWSAFPEEKVKSVAYFDPLWFDLYANENSRPMVLKWIKEKDIFSKKYVLVPIVMWSHWSLLIFSHLGESLNSKGNAPCMLLLDSLQAIGPTRLEPLIRRLLLDIYESEDRLENRAQLKKMPLLIPKVPQQNKGEECGFYVLHYIHLFLDSAPQNFNISEGYPYFMTNDWFTNEEMESFYERLDSIVLTDANDSGSEDSSDCILLVENFET